MTTNSLSSLHETAEAVRCELAQAVVGQQEVIDQLLAAILAGQHCLLEAAPGSAKRLLVSSWAKSLGLTFHRVHCTPDLTAHELLARALADASRQSVASLGQATLPHVLLIDDISRLPAATRVVVQQAMQDGGGGHADQSFVVPDPFIVLATKYRQEDEPADVADEPRDDRYMLKIVLRSPSYHDEFHVSDAPLVGPEAIQPVADADRLRQFQEVARQVVAPVHVVHYALRLVRSTRIHDGRPPDFAYEWIGIGAGPRASHHLLTAAKMRAAWAGRDFAAIEDVQAMVHASLRHRLVANQNARSNGVTPDRIIDRLVYEIPVRIEGDDQPAVAGETPQFDLTSDEPWLGDTAD